jgi:hypothetical protein
MATSSTGPYLRKASLRALCLFSGTVGLRVGLLVMGARVVGRTIRLGAADGAEGVGTSEGDSDGQVDGRRDGIRDGIRDGCTDGNVVGVRDGGRLELGAGV